MNPLGIGERPQFWRQRAPVNDGVFLREQYAEVIDPHLCEDVHRFLSDGSTADDQRLQMATSELFGPFGQTQLSAPISVDQGVIKILICAHSRSTPYRRSVEFALHRLHRPRFIMSQTKCELAPEYAAKLRGHDDLRNRPQAQRLLGVHNLSLITLRQ